LKVIKNDGTVQVCLLYCFIHL